jgi:hypothetical protein
MSLMIMRTVLLGLTPSARIPPLWRSPKPTQLAGHSVLSPPPFDVLNKDVLTMRRFTALISGVLIGGVLVYAGFNYHLVRAHDGFLVVSRTQVALEDAYVDIRNWGITDWRKHPTLTRNMLKSGHAERVKAAVQDGLVKDALNGLGLTRQENDDESRQ